MAATISVGVASVVVDAMSVRGPVDTVTRHISYLSLGWVINPSDVEHLLLAAYRAKFPVRCTTRLMICSVVPLYSRTVLLRAQTSAVSLHSSIR